MGKELGKLIRDYRDRSGLSLRDLAAASRTSNEYLRKIELGDIENPSGASLVKLMTVLKIPSKKLIEVLEKEQENELQMAENYVSFATINMVEQENSFEINEKGTLKEIRYTQTVYNPSKKYAEKKFHRLTSNDSKWPLDHVEIHAEDDQGSLDQNIERHERSSQAIGFYVKFREPLSSNEGDYRYSWWAKNVPAFESDFEDMKNFSYSPVFYWGYEPAQLVKRFVMKVRHPSGLKIIRARFYSVDTGDIVSGSPTQNYSEDQKETVVDVANLPPGSYKLEWIYEHQSCQALFQDNLQTPQVEESFEGGEQSK